jgi:hypothetical protein
MATSTFYGWAEPDNSSLVKNGAADIRTLGDAIDTSVWNVGFGQAGKNKIINGDFNINQRAFSTTTTTNTYGFDRWLLSLSGGSGTYSTQAFTLGAAPVAGYESKNFARLAVTTGNDFCRLEQKIESVRTFAGQTATVSFWAKGTNPSTAGSLNVTMQQAFGGGGSPSATITTNVGSFVLTANWTRYSLTVAVPSISGKTLGTDGSDLISFGFGQGSSISTDAWTLDLWGVQAEYGSKATPFQTASGGSPQAELAMCQRYLPKLTFSSESFGFAYGTTGTQFYGYFTTTPRIAPTGITVSAASDFTVYNQSFSSGAATAIAFNNASQNSFSLTVTTTAASPTLVTGQPAKIQATGANASILWTGCEL